MADEIEQWAKERAMKLCLDLDPDNCARTVEAWEQNGATSFPAFARYIMEHEEDPLLKEAREICADKAKFHGNRARAFAFVEGHNDETEQVQLALSALRRGIELGKAGEV